MIELDKYEFSRQEKRLFYSIAAAVSMLVSFLYYKNVIFALVIVPFLKRIEGYVTDEILERRRMDYLVQFKDLLFMLATSVGAGRSMKDAIGESIPSLEGIYGEDGILVGEIKKVYERIAVGRENDVTVLYEMALASRLEDVIDYVTIYSICKTTGANLILALNRAANIIMDKITIEREIKELVIRKKKEGLLIFAMPTAVVLFLNLCAPDYISPLYETVQGRLIMTLVVGGNIMVYGMIQRIVRVDI